MINYKHNQIVPIPLMFNIMYVKFKIFRPLATHYNSIE